ncbi:DEAD/DEAH box helicase [archaeon]|jgi:ERCC4-related helicase|nr:DEAD/DEAH box helicase [archaeon]MBT3577518.1 DEAD/DEAH box helicase [archaeon]MBT6819935.1 DEAD/DEAH box helicase [archaeon]MBT6955857.1 DEAD/DEAH box helicase [archaeon]MBT7025491.1 DEAD/DEAH box helicase [archaeon]
MPYKDVIKLEPREYQKSIFETCKDNDCLVVLPTGTGKTHIAIMLAIQRFIGSPLEKVVILAPTRPLIEQHFESFKKQLPENWADMQLFTGKTPSKKRKEIWQTAEFIFSTPQCIANDLDKMLYKLDEVSLLIVDECHRCLKNYAYNRVAQKYKNHATNRRVLGLTASPGSDKKTITDVCKNLGIEAVEIRTRDSPDVRPYLQELEFEKIEVDFPTELQEINLLMKGIYDRKVQELKNRRVLFGYASKTMLLKLQSRLIMELRRKKDPNKMAAVSVCAQALKISHAVELLETQTLSSFISYLKGLFQQAAEKKSKGVQYLVKDPRFAKAYTLATTSSIEHPKLGKLSEIIQSQFEENPKSKIIIFAQFRETLLKIAETLEKIQNVKPCVFVGQAIKKHGKGKTTGLKQKEQKAMINKFKEGEFNILLATSIAEEGLDIPEVDEVIFYEPVPSAIRKIQRAGRTARLSKGSLKILITKNTRDQIYHYAAHHKEKRMHSAIDEIKKTFERNGKLSDNSQEKLF